MIIHLTDLALQKLTAEGQDLYWDTNLPGFGVRVGKRAKTFIVKKDNFTNFLANVKRS